MLGWGRMGGWAQCVAASTLLPPLKSDWKHGGSVQRGAGATTPSLPPMCYGCPQDRSASAPHSPSSQQLCSPSPLPSLVGPWDWGHEPSREEGEDEPIKARNTPTHPEGQPSPLPSLLPCRHPLRWAGDRVGEGGGLEKTH